MPETRVEIIAEAGVNHNGDPALALALVDAAAKAGADTVKFQTFRADALATEAAPKAAYQNRTTEAGESQHAMLKRLELTEADHEVLIARCAARGIGFLSTPFDPGSLAMLTGRFGLGRLKLGSGEVTNAPLLLAAGRSGAGVILSTGMATLDEVREALGVLSFAMTSKDAPSRAGFARAFESPLGQAALQARVAILHCTTEYPAPVPDTNLRAMETMAREFGLRTGYSDHTEGHAIAIAAVALGATIIEKHLTLDRGMPGPDHLASVEADALATMCREIRAVEASLGDGIKRPSASERKNMAVARKSLVAARDLPAGHRLSEADIAVMRPGDGRSPVTFWELVGATIDQPLAKGDPL